jgi:hypothetical protein
VSNRSHCFVFGVLSERFTTGVELTAARLMVDKTVANSHVATTRQGDISESLMAGPPHCKMGGKQ